MKLNNMQEMALFIRMFEEEISRRYSENEMRCPVHLSLGQENQATGAMSALKKEDFVVSSHRSHAHYLAKGGDPYRMLCELYGKADGCSRGQGGSMHLVDWNVGFAGSTSIVAGTIPVGVGLSFAAKFKRQDHVTAVCLGDAALEEGVFHESANFASLHHLPVVFVVENNEYSCYTHIRERQPLRLNKGFKDIAQAHGLNYIYEESQDVERINLAMHRAVDKKPCLLELKTKRMNEHCGPTLYYEPKPGPKHIQDHINELFIRAKAAPYPHTDEAGAYLYANLR